MALFKIQIMNQRETTVSQWKEKNNGAAALEWARSQAVEIFGSADNCRYFIEEEKPVAV